MPCVETKFVSCMQPPGMTLLLKPSLNPTIPVAWITEPATILNMNPDTGYNYKNLRRISFSHLKFKLR